VKVLSRFIAASSIVLAITFITGCSLSNSKQTATNVPSGTSTKEITILLPEYSTASSRFRNSTFEKSARLFEQANPGVKVTVEKLPMPKGYRTAIMERLKDSKPVDLIFGTFDPVLNEQSAFAADLTPFFKADKMTTDDLYENIVEMAKVNGKLLGIPMAPTPLAVFYNKEWFNKADIPFPGKEWTWEQFLNQSIKLQAANQVAGKEIYGSIVPLETRVFESLAVSSGHSIISPDGKRMSGYLNSKPVAEALTKLLFHMNTNKASKGVPSVTDPVLQELRAFNAGMGIGAIQMFSYLESNQITAGKFGIAGLPYMDKGVRANALYFSMLSISGGSKQKELAWKFMKDIVLNGDSQFQKDWAKEELLTVKSAFQKSGQHLVPGLDVLAGELEHGIKPVVYRNAAINTVRIANNRLLSATTEAEVMASLSDVVEEVDKELTGKK
jgi:multiple sugar transport system substrate-binding protein